jgi:hypothetical protein
MKLFTPVAGMLMLCMVHSSLCMKANTDTSFQKKASGIDVPVAPVKKMYDEDAKSWYAVYNKNNTIHVYLAVTDLAQQKKIVMNGIELWIDAKGKKNKKTGLFFPMADEQHNRPAQPAMDFNNHAPNNAADKNNIAALEKIIAGKREMKLTGFREDVNGIQNIVHPSGIEVSLYFIKDTLVYEAQLPLNTLPETIAIDSRISIGIIEKGMEARNFMGDGMPPPGADGDGMMQPPPGDGPPPGEDGRMHMFEDDVIWYKFSLHSDSTL